MLNNLEEKGYIGRIEKTKNKRQANIIILTEKGAETLDKLAHIIIPMFDNVHERMTYDKDYLKNGLTQLRELMREEIDIQI